MRISDWSSDVCSSDLSYRSRTNLLNPLSVYGEQEGYGLTNAGLGIKDPDDRWSVQIWGRNLLDKIYAVGIQSANPVAPFFKIPGDRRPFGLTETGRASCRETVCQYV